MMLTKSKEELVQEFRVQSIQEAAMRVIARKGMAAATMSDIAREAGIAKGTIYLYFRDRDELVEKTFETAITELHRRIDAALEGDATFSAKLRALLSAQMEFFRENREFFRLYMSLRYPEGSPAQQRRQKRICQPQYRTRVASLAAILERAMDAGEIRRMNAARLALLVAEMSIAITIERVMEESPPAAEDDIEMIATMILQGIGLQHP
ncbi:MAG TPA: TetR/AcrR family transcriptional regulator [Thermoanaerobaculia bacterium]|nr:TetR/AcrR family transcriptional regulator [Thermoanaerobaculia bacterium]